MQRGSKIVVSWWLGLFQMLLLRYVRVEDSWAGNARSAAKRGRLIFVLRNRSLIDLLCIRGLCRRHGLPDVSFVAGMSPFLYTPLWLWLIRLFRRERDADRLKRLTETLDGGGCAVVFLRRPAVGGALGSQPVEVDGIRLAARAQSSLEVPVLAMPTVFLWGEHAMKRLPGTMDFLFGSNEYPRLLRSVWLLLRRRSVHELTSGEPLDLAAIKKERSATEDVLVGVVRAGVGRQIEKIRRSRLGSLTKPSARIKTEVLGSHRLRAELATIAEKDNLEEKEVASKSAAIIKKLAADFHPRVISLFSLVMSFVWRRIYTGIEVVPEDMERMRKVLSEGPTLILPTHKSHIDYIVISQVMQSNNMMLPHIAAGQNLSFWPMGWIFRSSGAFFIRRRFINDRFYAAVVNAYVRRLIQEGYSIEVFIEGGRSRTGKLLRPQLGMIEMSLKALAVTPRLNIQVLPTFIGYERVIEEGAYVKESRGQSKKAESIKGLLKSTKVLLSRYGQLYVRVGEPFPVKDVLADMGCELGDLEQGSTRREVALEVALRTYSEINRVTVVTPSAVLATVLLSHRGARINHEELRGISEWLVEVLKRQGASLSDFLRKWGIRDEDTQPGEDLLDRTIKAFVRGGRIRADKKSGVYTIHDGQRLPLDYYKNNIIHFLVPTSLVCAACLIAKNSVETVENIVKKITLAAHFYRYEFMLAVGKRGEGESLQKEADTLVQRALDLLEKEGILERTGEKVSIVDRDKARFLSDILMNFHEIYFSVIAVVRLRALEQVSGDTSKKALAFAQEQLGSGRFSRPEGHSRINLQNAIQAFKELKILRPISGATPYAEGEIGDRIYRYLEATTKIAAGE